MPNCMLLLSLFLNHNNHVHNHNYCLHNHYCTTTWTSMIQCLHTTTLKQKKPLTFILHTHNYYPKIILFLMPNKPSFTNKTISITIFYNITPLQQPQTQTSNPNEHPIANEDPIIRFHEENMDDFSEHGDQELFRDNNDQSNDEGVVVPTSPPLEYHQPRCPVELNLWEKL